MTGEPSHRPLGVAPSVAMDAPVLPRRGLSAGAIGHGTHGRRYRLLAPIQRGGMGELFLTLVSEPGRPDGHVVIKRLLADLVDDPKYVEMFRSEAWVMRNLDHANIVAVYDTPVIDRAQCLAMELVHGKSAQQILARCEVLGRPVPPTVALEIMAKILRALEYAHAFRLEGGEPLNLVHRDVSPGNVLISFEGAVKLTDFGIAKSQMSVVSTTVGIVKGKARYLAPEQILGEQASPRSDIFSAAAVTCELLTGEPTFDCSSVPKTLYAIVNGERRNLTEQLDFRAPMLVQLLDRALATDPTARVQTAAELAAGFEAQARVLAPQVGQPDVGQWLTELFEGEEDPVGHFLQATPAAPATESATEAGYRPESPLPRDEPPATVLERARAPSAAPATEVLERPSVPAPSSSAETTGRIPAPSTTPAFRATIAGSDTEPPLRANPRSRTVVEAELVDPAPTVSGFGDETHVVRRRTRPVEGSADVNEALSMLAFLQAQRGRSASVVEKGPADDGSSQTRPALAAPKVRPPRPAPVADDAPLPELRPQRGQKALMLVAGIVLGVLGTLGTQAVLPKPKAPEAAPRLVAMDSPEPELRAPPPVRSAPAPEVAEAAAPPDPPPVPEPVAAPATLDVTYPKGARVWLDGEALPGRVPIRDVQLSDGPHELRVKKRRYRRKVSFEAAPGMRFVMKKALEQSVPGS